MASELPDQTLAAETGDDASGAAMIITMGVIGLLCAIMIVATFQFTFEPIKRNKAVFLEKSIFQVLPDTTAKITFGVFNGELRPATGDEEPNPGYYAGYNADGELTGIAVEAEGQGFADILRILYGYSPTCKCIVGMKVLASKETPGLGDKIETDAVFRANFEALQLLLDDTGTTIINPIVLVKPRQKTDPWQIESISGATISSRAIADMLAGNTARTIPFIEQNIEIFAEGGR
jgi:electron transport complex protein RnfG